MAGKNSRLIKIISVIAIILLTILATTIFDHIKENNLKKSDEEYTLYPLIVSNQTYLPNSLDINVNFKYSITLDDKIKGTDIKIIKAVRQAIFDYGCYLAAFTPNGEIPVNEDIYVSKINKTGNNTWVVWFSSKPNGQKDYDEGYSIIKIKKEKSGLYKGVVPRHGSPLIVGETET